MTIGFQWSNNLINGSTGPYDNKTGQGKSANAGIIFANLLKNRNLWQLNNSTVQYSNMNGGYDNGQQYVKAPDPQLSVKSALAFSTEALKGYDTNKTGVITRYEFSKGLASGGSDADALKYGKTVDLNDDGKIDAGELSAWQIYQDGQTVNQTFVYDPNNKPYFGKNSVDGKVTAYEAKMAKEQVKADPDKVKTELQKIYTDFDIENVKKDFTMPEKATETPPVEENPPVTPPATPKNNFAQMFAILIQLLMRSFGGFGITYR